MCPLLLLKYRIGRVGQGVCDMGNGEWAMGGLPASKKLLIKSSNILGLLRLCGQKRDHRQVKVPETWAWKLQFLLDFIFVLVIFFRGVAH